MCFRENTDSNVPGPQKRWPAETSFQSEKLNVFVHTTHFKMEGMHMWKDIHK